MSAKDTQLTTPAFYILLALATGPRHGYDIMKQAKSDSNGQCMLGPGTLYGSIKRMLADGLIQEVEDKVQVDDRPRRYYQLTSKGQQSLSAQLQQYQQAITAAGHYNLLLDL